MRGIIAEFPMEYRDELEVQLGDSLLKWIRRRSSRIRKCRLPNADRHLLKLLRERKWNISRLAKDLGCHRNTLHRRLHRIRIKLRRILLEKCPIEIESALWRQSPPEHPKRAELEALLQRPNASACHVRRATIILAILDGQTYTEITHTMVVSVSTIACWRRRFEQDGVSGLIARHRGRKPSRTQRRLRQWLRNTPSDKRPSLRALAERFRLGKSTVQWILKRKA